MYNKHWRRHNDTSVAVDAILDAAGQAFLESGVSGAKMVDVARLAGCSRATLYHYFPNREALHQAFMARSTLRITERIAAAESERSPAPLAELLTKRILSGIEWVRNDPMLALWFQPENISVPLAVTKNSEFLLAVAADSVDRLTRPEVRRELERRAEWMLRCIVSLLAMPGPDPETERAMVEAYLVPVLIAPLPGAPAAGQKARRKRAATTASASADKSVASS